MNKTLSSQRNNRVYERQFFFTIHTNERTRLAHVMKSFTLILLIGLAVLLVSVNGAPANDKKIGTSHKLKTTSTTTTVSPARKCKSECPNDYNPICGSDGAKVNLSFGNKCVMEKYNCEHNTKLTVKLNAECPNSKGIRLA